MANTMKAAKVPCDAAAVGAATGASGVTPDRAAPAAVPAAAMKTLAWAAAAADAVIIGAVRING